MTPTQSEFDVVLKLWPVIVSVVLLVAWFIRLESRGDHQKDKQDELKEFVKESNKIIFDKLDTLQKQHNELSQLVTRLEGQLSNSKRSDL